MSKGLGVNRKGKSKRGRLPPFVPLLVATMDSSAWRATSHGARLLYISLKKRASNDASNNGNIFLSQREAKAEVGGSTDSIVRWFRELEHYGFIVMTQPATNRICPRWRLTELGAPRMQVGPTRDFQKWDGSRFQAAQKQNQRLDIGNAALGNEERQRLEMRNADRSQRLDIGNREAAPSAWKQGTDLEVPSTPTRQGERTEDAGKEAATVHALRSR